MEYSRSNVYILYVQHGRVRLFGFVMTVDVVRRHKTDKFTKLGMEHRAESRAARVGLSDLRLLSNSSRQRIASAL